MIDVVIQGIKLKSGKSLKKDTGEVKLWSDIYTPDGNLARVYGFDSNHIPDFSKVACKIRIMSFDDGRQYIQFISEVK